MPAVTVYFPGGFDPNAPNHNLGEQWNPDAGTFTRWDEGGNVVESRPLTADELAALVPAPTVVVPDIVTLANNLAALTEAVDFLILDSLGGL